MIVWLASYPRSGNTLLRQVLHRCFGLKSYEGPGSEFADRAEFPNRKGWMQAREMYGPIFPVAERHDFLANARASSERVLIKTHERPPDDSPAIYVVRDGRLVLQSYVRFHQTNHGGRSTFAPLLLGDDPYGDWTSHYEAWCEQHTGPLLEVRFEELVDASPELLSRIAEFIGHQGDIAPWVNPQAKLQQLVPSFFGPGSARWTPDEFWTPSRLAQFYALHGPLLERLGYVDADELRRHVPGPEAIEWVELTRLAFGHSRRLRPYEAICNEQERQIRHLERIVRWLEGKPVLSRLVQTVRRWTDPILKRA